jgi:hypothetical protein
LATGTGRHVAQNRRGELRRVTGGTDVTERSSMKKGTLKLAIIGGIVTVIARKLSNRM